jgi:hypothetical protein
MLRKTAIATLLLLCCAADARADVPPPGLQECDKKKAGDPCTLTAGGAQGTCTESTCSKGRFDAASTYACLLCKVGSQGDGGTPSDATKPAAGDGPGSKPPVKDEGGCTVGGLSARVIGPWLLAASVSALLLLARRLRRRR